jgi:hypothetical protein
VHSVEFEVIYFLVNKCTYPTILLSQHDHTCCCLITNSAQTLGLNSHVHRSLEKISCSEYWAKCLILCLPWCVVSLVLDSALLRRRRRPYLLDVTFVAVVASPLPAAEPVPLTFTSLPLGQCRVDPPRLGPHVNHPMVEAERQRISFACRALLTQVPNIYNPVFILSFPSYR